MRSLFRPQDWPIITKLIIAFLLVALIPLAIAGFVSQAQARDGLLKSAQLNLINAARRTSAAIDNYVVNRRDDVLLTAKDESVVSFMSADRATLDLRSNRDALATRRLLASKINAVGAYNKPYFFIARVDKDPGLNGKVELTSNVDRDQEGAIPAGELSDVSNQVYFLEAIKGFYYISDPVLTEFGDNNVDAIMYYSAPILDVKDPTKVIGVVVARSSIFPIWQLVNGDDAVAGSGSFGMLIDNTNRLGIRIADSRTSNRPQDRTSYLFSIMQTLSTAPGENSRSRYLDSGRFPDNFNYQQAQQPLSNVYESAQGSYDKDNPFFSTAVGQEDARVGYTRLGAKPSWYYYVVVPQSTYAAAANDISRLTIFVLIGAVVLVILLATLFARLLTTPVRRISRVLTRIGIGDFEARVPVRGNDELGRLGESLNAMFDNTLTLIQTREEKDELQGRITSLLNEISEVADGDLTVEAEVTADITGAIADSFNLMIEELRKVILNIQQATGQANILIDQVVTNTQRTDQAADRQAARILNVSSAIADIDRSVQQVSENANTSSLVAQEARQNAYLGSMAVTKSVSSMNRIRGNVQETAKKIKRLGESSQQIGEIVKLIDDIADQTNMLALNAAIQAAMAGEQGKGFSVVAEEVRRLAERSTSATREIATLVKSIQDDTNEAVVAMEESTREVVEGSKVADEAGQALGAIQTVVDRLADLIFAISQVTQQQAASSSSVAQSMTEISALTMEATSLRRESAQAVEKLDDIVQSLNGSVSAFRVTSGQPKAESALPSQTQSNTWGQALSDTPPFSTQELEALTFRPEATAANSHNQPPSNSGYPSYYNIPTASTKEPGEASGMADAGENLGILESVENATTSRPRKKDDFNLGSLLPDDDDFFESLFNEKGSSPADGRPRRPGPTK